MHWLIGIVVIGLILFVIARLGKFASRFRNTINGRGIGAMIVLELEPGKGFGPIKLGSSREEARAATAAIGFPLELSRADSDHFCKSAIETECDKDGRVMFVGVWCSRAFVARYHGVDVFDVTARELFQMAANADDSGDHEFNRLEYCFPNQVLTLWNVDSQHDCRGRGKGTREVWGQVGLGNDAYVSVIKALEDDA